MSLNLALSLLASLYEMHQMAAQIGVAGNNSQSLTEEGILILGNDKEPSLLHGHVLGRGNPKANYIGQTPLRGPVAGRQFNMRGDGTDEGNSFKVKWKSEEMKEVADQLSQDLVMLLNSNSPYRPNIKILSIRP
jgi:hypothetical protein